MTVTIPPRPPEIEDQRSVEEQIAEFEALIKEARQRARRRRAAYAAVVLAALAGVITGAIGIGGGGVDIDSSVAEGSPASAANMSRARGVAIAASTVYISQIQVNPTRPNILYAGTLGPRSVVKSTDAGKTWSAADEGLTNPASPTDSEDLRVDALALDPRSPDVLYAGTGLGVFKTTDGAQTWKLASTGIDLGGGLAHRMLEGFIYAIAIDPVHTSTVYASGRNLWKTTNGGATWKRVLRRGAISLGIDPRRPETVYAGAFMSGDRTSILKTTDGGGNWRSTGPPGLHDTYFGHPIVVDRRAPGIVYAAGSRGLFASPNQGFTWSKLLPLRNAFSGVGVIALDPVRANVLYVGTTRGVVKSDNGGQTWSAPRLAGFVSSLAITRTNPQTIYASVRRTTTPQTWAVFASTDGGDTWHRRF